jgi:hypothetical protein
MSRATRFGDIGRQRAQRGATVVALGHQVDTVAQHRRAGGLERPPRSLPGGGVLGRQGQDESNQMHYVDIKSKMH